MCPKHPAAKARFANFGTGVIVTCDSGNHLVRLCEREQFEAERAEAQSNLFPKP